MTAATFQLKRDFDFEDPRLGQRDSYVLLIMKIFSCGEQGVAYPGIPLLVCLTRTSVTSVYRSLKSLTELGYLVPVGDNRYEVNLDAQYESPHHKSYPQEGDSGESYPQPSATDYQIDNPNYQIDKENYQIDNPLYREIDLRKTFSKSEKPVDKIQIQNPPPKVKIELAGNGGDPSLAAQKMHHHRATTLGVGEKRPGESWSAFILRINGAIAPPRVQRYESGVAIV